MRILIAEDDLSCKKELMNTMGKFGEFDIATNGIEVINSFSKAMNDKTPYRLICMDVMILKSDEMKTLEAIRKLEMQCGVAYENRVKFIITITLDEVQQIQLELDNNCETYITKPIEGKNLIECMRNIGVFAEMRDNQLFEMLIETERDEVDKKTAKYNTIDNRALTNMYSDSYFKSVYALPDYHLKVIMETGTSIKFNFQSRLDTMRFGKLRDVELFQSVRTDGNNLIFEKIGKVPVKITAAEFMDLVLIDRRRYIC